MFGEDSRRDASLVLVVRQVLECVPAAQLHDMAPPRGQIWPGVRQRLQSCGVSLNTVHPCKVPHPREFSGELLECTLRFVG